MKKPHQTHRGFNKSKLAVVFLVITGAEGKPIFAVSICLIIPCEGYGAGDGCCADFGLVEMPRLLDLTGDFFFFKPMLLVNVHT